MLSFKEHYNTSLFVVNGEPSLSEGLSYHVSHNISLCDPVFRIYSEGYFKLIEEARSLYFSGTLEVCDEDAELLESELGKKGIYEGREVFLEAPIFLEEAEILEEADRAKKKKQGQHRLGSPFRTPGGPKKFAVYVRTKNGDVKKVTFGDPKMRVRNNSAKRAKSFNARHKCSTKKDRTTAGYWSCHVGRFSKALGLKSNRAW